MRDDRKERRSGRDDSNSKSSKRRYEHSVSPSDTHRERTSGKERILDREREDDRKERRSGRDDTDNKSSKRKHERSVSPSDAHKERTSGKERISDKERETEREMRGDRKERRSGRGDSRGRHEQSVSPSDKHKERTSGKERISDREREMEREKRSDRKERRSGRDDTNSKSSRGRHEQSVSPSDRNHGSRHRSRSPPSYSRAHDEVTNSGGAEQRDGDDAIAKMKAAEDALEAKEKQKPTFELSGKLAAETNRVRGVTLLFNEPPDARKPDIRWRLYVFKAGEVLNEPLYIHRQSCYLFGRERRVADIPTDHPSCSKQHAVIQFRQVEKEQPDGTLTKQVRPYIMDLGSTNKTFINDNPIEPQRYYELFEKDTIKFGNSSREYVLLHENSAQ